MSTLFKGVQYSREYTIIYLNIQSSKIFGISRKLHSVMFLVPKEYLSILKTWWVSLVGYNRLLIKRNNNVGYLVSLWFGLE